MDDSSLKTVLEENLRLAKENNKMLRAMHRSMWYGVIWKIIIWGIILGLPVYMYYVYKPLIDPIIHTFAPSQTTATSTSFFSPDKIQALLKQYEAKK